MFGINRLTRGRVDFYQEHLNRVSRSFAFCIERLPSPLRSHVSLAYLICRILDSVEDADWSDKNLQLQQFDEFDRFLVGPIDEESLRNWVARFPPGLPEGECLLLPETSKILRDLHALPVDVREAITEPVFSMSRGMRYFAERRVDGELRLRSLTEVNQYCFFVAGVVGEILTRLISLNPTKGDLDEGMLINAFHFGLFLQKVNLLKDQLTDEENGRYLVPSRAETLASMREHGRRAIDYITAIPERLLGYRLFCSWSLFLGLASLPFIEKSWSQKKLIKIPRLATRKLLNEIENVVGDNQRLRQKFEVLFAASGVASVLPGSEATQVGETDTTTAAHEFPRLYRGRLAASHLRAFGLS